MPQSNLMLKANALRNPIQVTHWRQEAAKADPNHVDDTVLETIRSQFLLDAKFFASFYSALEKSLSLIPHRKASSSADVEQSDVPVHVPCPSVDEK